jgi:hypothetical protein
MSKWSRCVNKLTPPRFSRTIARNTTHFSRPFLPGHACRARAERENDVAMLVGCLIDRARTLPGAVYFFSCQNIPSNTCHDGCRLRFIHRLMSLRWRQLDTVLNKNCREDAIKSWWRHPLPQSLRIYYIGLSRHVADLRGTLRLHRDIRVQNGWNQMLTMAYGNFTAGLPLSHKRTSERSGTRLVRERIIMRRAAQLGRKQFSPVRVGIDNQLQFTANLCTAHIRRTSPGTTGV